MPRVLITGASGQDGVYLTRFLHDQGHEVHGLVRATDPPPPDLDLITVHVGDLTDRAFVATLLKDVRPERIFNLAGVSSVAACWRDPAMAAEVNGVAAINLMEHAWRLQEANGQVVAFVQATSAEIFGEATNSPQNERTPVNPVTPYGATKAFAHHAISVYRHRGLNASSLILFNHESPLRSPSFVTRKITRAVAAIAAGQASELRLGNLEATRDWGWAPDYVRAMALAAAAPVSDDYVIGTGEAHSVRDFVAAAFHAAGIVEWERHVVVDPAFIRPVDPALLVADSSKARLAFGWSPSMTFKEVVAAMVVADLSAFNASAAP